MPRSKRLDFWDAVEIDLSMELWIFGSSGALHPKASAEIQRHLRVERHFLIHGDEQDDTFRGC